MQLWASPAGQKFTKKGLDIKDAADCGATTGWDGMGVVDGVISGRRE
jgi:hypothetical protein